MKRLPLLLLLLIMLTSCTEDGSTAGTAQSEDIARPDITLTKAAFTLGQDGENPLFIEGESLSFFMNEDTVYASDITFTQRDDDGGIFISGRAGYGIINTETRRADLSEGVELTQHRDGLSIEADSLVFDSERQTVESPGAVNVVFSDGAVRGSNLSADLKSSTFEIMTIERGEIIP